MLSSNFLFIFIFVQVLVFNFTYGKKIIRCNGLYLYIIYIDSLSGCQKIDLLIEITLKAI